MRLAAATVALLAFLAGCSDAPAADSLPETDSATGTDGPGTDAEANPEPAAPVPMALPVLLEGNLGNFAHYCVFPAGQCQTHVVTADETDVLVEHPGSNFTGLDLDLTWTAASAATERLAIGFMVMAECDGCSTAYEGVVGTSPLRATLSGENVPLNATARVHIFVYNPQGFQMLPGGAGYTFTSVDQAFRLEGLVNVAMDA